MHTGCRTAEHYQLLLVRDLTQPVQLVCKRAEVTYGVSRRSCSMDVQGLKLIAALEAAVADLLKGIIQPHYFQRGAAERTLLYDPQGFRENDHIYLRTAKRALRDTSHW